MRRALTCLPLALLFIAIVPSKAQKTAAEDAEIVVVVREGAPLELACALRVEQQAEWQREGSSKLPRDLEVAKESAAGAGGLTARLHAKAARPEFAGVYSCTRGPQAQRLRVVVEPRAATLAAAEPALTTLAPATTTPKPIPERVPLVDGSPTLPGAEQYYDVQRNMSFTCNIANPGSEKYVWEKNNTDISKVPELNGRYKLIDSNKVLDIKRTTEDDAGNYTCKLGGKQLYWELKARPYTKFPDSDTSVVEGQKLKLVCKMMGKPYVPVEWWYNEDPASYNEKTSRGKQLETNDRIKLETSEAGVVNGQLVIEAAERADAGAYACLPVVELDARTPFANAVTVLRIKDMYAALWPFLGICAEVLVLCAIILVYEKRRTKPELDDSDTDNHDQKKS